MFLLLISTKMATIGDILTFISRIDTTVLTCVATEVAGCIRLFNGKSTFYALGSYSTFI